MTDEAILYLIAGLMLAMALVLVFGMIRSVPVRAPWVALAVLLVSMFTIRSIAFVTDGLRESPILSEGDLRLVAAGWSMGTAALVLVAVWLLKRETQAHRQSEEMRRQHLADLWTSEQRYRDSEHRLRLALDAARLGEWRLELDTRAVESNALCRKNLGLPPDAEFTHEIWRQLIHPADRQRVIAALERAIADRTVFDEEYRTVRPDGGVGWTLSSGRCQYDDSGRAIFMAGINLDISSRKQSEQQRAALLANERAARSAAERASWMKDEFLATLSHELRTPLTAIHGWCRILRRDRNPEDLDVGLEVIERNAQSQTKIIEDLLDMSRIISGKVLLDIKQVNLAQILLASIESARAAADAKQIALEVALGHEACEIPADPNRLQQVFSNLLSNAIKFTPTGGQVRVSLTRSCDSVEAVVEDSGEGIRPEFLPFVFDRFRQADASTTRRHRGLGIGLAIVKQLVELHGGSVQAASAGEKLGAKFAVVLRRHPKEAQRAEQPSTSLCDGDAPAIGTKRSLAGLRVLLVEDEADVRTLVTKLLEDHEAVVTARTSASEGLESLKLSTPDILISDIGMPEQDGFEFIRQVRQMKPRPEELPAIALSAYARQEDRARALAAGFQTHAAKPIEEAELVSLVADLCGRT